jgi:hypothetical protein
MSIHTYQGKDGRWLADIEHKSRKLIAELEATSEYGALGEAMQIAGRWKMAMMEGRC